MKRIMKRIKKMIKGEKGKKMWKKE